MPDAKYCVYEPDKQAPLFGKLIFIYNAVEDGWKVNKNNDDYVFSKPHEGKMEVYSPSFLTEFIAKQLRSPAN